MRVRRDMTLTRRRPLREEIYQVLLELLLQGDLTPGSDINEQELCAQLGVSRTPLREALIRLEQDGFLRSDMSRGFTVRSPSESEIRDVYPIIGTLESMAVRSRGDAIGEAIPELAAIIGEMEAVDAESYAEAEALDLAWHARVRAACGNAKVQELVTLLHRLVGRYEFAYMRDLQLRARSIEQHREVLQAFQAGDLDAAAGQLEEHWRHAMEQDLAALRRWQARADRSASPAPIGSRSLASGERGEFGARSG